MSTDMQISILLDAQNKASQQIADVKDKIDALGKKSVPMSTTAFVGLGVAIGGVIAIGKGLSDVLRVTMEFEKTMSGVEAVTGASRGEMLLLEEQTRELGATTEHSSTAVAKGYEMLARNGITTKQILGGMGEATLNLASAMSEDLAPSADVLTDAITQFKIKQEDLVETTNIMVGVTQNSKFKLNDLKLAYAQVGGIAGASGVKFEDFNVIMAKSSYLFASGSDFGTSFKTMLMRLGDPTTKISEKMTQVGVSLYDTEGKMRSMRDIGQDLHLKFDGLNTAQKHIYSTLLTGAPLQQKQIKGLKDLGISILDNNGIQKKAGVLMEEMKEKTKDLTQEEIAKTNAVLGGTDAARMIIGISEGGAEAYDKAADKISKANAKLQAEIRLDNLAGDVTKMGSVYEAVQLQIGDVMGGGMRDITQGVTNAIASVGEFIKDNEVKIRFYVEKIKKIYNDFFGGLIRTYNENKDEIGSILGTISTIWINIFNGISAFVGPVFEGIKKTIGGAVRTISYFFSGDLAGAFWGLVDVVSGVGEIIINGFLAVGNAISLNFGMSIFEVISHVKTFGLTAWSYISQFAEGTKLLITNTIPAAFAIVAVECVTWIKDLVLKGKKHFNLFTNTIKVLFGNLADNIGIAISNAMVYMLKPLKTGLTSLVTAINVVVEQVNKMGAGIEPLSADNLFGELDKPREFKNIDDGLDKIQAATKKTFDKMILDNQEFGKTQASIIKEQARADIKTHINKYKKERQEIEKAGQSEIALIKNHEAEKKNITEKADAKLTQQIKGDIAEKERIKEEARAKLLAAEKQGNKNIQNEVKKAEAQKSNIIKEGEKKINIIQQQANKVQIQQEKTKGTLINKENEKVTASIKGTLQKALQVTLQSSLTVQAAVLGMNSSFSNIDPSPILKAVNSIHSETGAKLSSLIDKAYSWGSNMMGMFSSGINSKITGIKASIGGVMASIKAVAGFHSPPAEGPASDSDTWFPNMMKMFTAGIVALTPSVVGAMEDVTGGIAGEFQKSFVQAQKYIELQQTEVGKMSIAYEEAQNKISGELSNLNNNYEEGTEKHNEYIESLKDDLSTLKEGYIEELNKIDKKLNEHVVNIKEKFLDIKKEYQDARSEFGMKEIGVSSSKAEVFAKELLKIKKYQEEITKLQVAEGKEKEITKLELKIADIRTPLQKYKQEIVKNFKEIQRQQDLLTRSPLQKSIDNIDVDFEKYKEKYTEKLKGLQLKTIELKKEDAEGKGEIAQERGELTAGFQKKKAGLSTNFEEAQAKQLAFMQTFEGSKIVLNEALTEIEGKAGNILDTVKTKQAEITGLVAEKDRIQAILNINDKTRTDAETERLESLLKKTEETLEARRLASENFASSVGVYHDNIYTSAMRAIEALERLEAKKNSNKSGGKRAEGGPVEKGTEYLVGEKGPEMFVPNQSGYIVPNDKISQKQVQKNNSFNITININGSSDPEETAEYVKNSIMQELQNARNNII